MTDNHGDNGGAVTLGLDPSFGFGDRIGLATPGHVQALRAAGAPIRPIFPQQSIREMERTGRTPAGVMADALAGMAQAGWDGPTGADADHLKTPEDVRVTTEAGFRFFTIDPSDAVDEHADRYDEAALRERYAAVREQVDWVPEYAGRTVTLPGGLTLDFTEEACLRCAVKYGPALNRAAGLAQEIRSRNAGRDYEIELSVGRGPMAARLGVRQRCQAASDCHSMSCATSAISRKGSTTRATWRRWSGRCAGTSPSPATSVRTSCRSTPGRTSCRCIRRWRAPPAGAST